MYLYGIVEDQDVLGDLPEGVGGAPVETVVSGDLTALVSPLVDDEVRMRRRDLRRHLNVVERAFAVATILPCPFGTVVDDESTLRDEFMGSRRADLQRALARLRGRSQFNVKAEYDEEAVLRAVVHEQPAIQRLRDETRTLGEAGHFARIRLGELVAEALQMRRATDATRILDQLRRVSEDEAVEDPRGELDVVRGAFLVADAQRFDRCLDELANSDGGRILYESIGPLPPTAFAAEAAGLAG